MAGILLQSGMECLHKKESRKELSAPMSDAAPCFRRSGDTTGTYTCSYFSPAKGFEHFVLRKGFRITALI